MEARKLTVVDTSTQRTVTFMSTAETVAELKADLSRQGINTNGMTIYEGLTKTELKSNDSSLPHDVPYKGESTNNLVFRLTKSEKNIRSGASRGELYEQIKKLGIADSIKAKYGKNFTQCSSAALEEAVAAANKKAAKPAPAPKAEKPAAPAKENKDNKPAGHSCKAAEAVATLTSILAAHGLLSSDDVKAVSNVLGTPVPEGDKDPYSPAEINSMFDFCK